VYESGGRRGYFRVYNKKLKKLLYLIGKKDYSYNDKRVRTRFTGRFYGKFALGDDKVEIIYRKKKMKAMESTSQDPMSAGQIKYKEQRDILLWRLRKELKMTYQEMQNYLEEYDFSINYSQIRNICVKFGDKAEDINKKTNESAENVDKIDENTPFEPENDENELIYPETEEESTESEEILG
jgi:transposase